MLIELHGGQFANKGAQKMLMTTIREIGARIPDARFAADACVGAAEDLKAHGLETILLKRGWMGQRRFGPAFAAQVALGALAARLGPPRPGALPLQHMGALVDLSGFAFSDQWGAKPTRDFAKLARHYRAAGKPVILLPQALGPFEHADIGQSFRSISESACRIYARDNRSLGYARAVAAPGADIRICPDMTFPVGAEFHDAREGRPACLVPNARMLDQGRLSEEEYLGALGAVANALEGRVPVRILVHDASGADRRLAEALNARLATPASVIEETDPWKIKSEIATASMVIASRYHSLVAALSCGVPSLAIGWSHKYDELLSDFGCGDCLFSLKDDGAALVEKAVDLATPETNQNLRAGLRVRAGQIGREVSDMWDQVAGILREGQVARAA